MEKLCLNSFRYIIEDVEKQKRTRIDCIVRLKDKITATSQDSGRKGETSYQRTVLKTESDGLSAYDKESNTYSSDNPVCRKLLEMECRTIDNDTFHVRNSKGKTKMFKIIEKQKIS